MACPVAGHDGIMLRQYGKRRAAYWWSLRLGTGCIYCMLILKCVKLYTGLMFGVCGCVLAVKIHAFWRCRVNVDCCVLVSTRRVVHCWCVDRKLRRCCCAQDYACRVDSVVFYKK